MKKIKICLALLIFVPIIIVLLPFIILFVITYEIKESISLRMFRRRENGNLYLICTSKRYWYNYIKNNLITILPDNIRVVWHKRKRGGRIPEIIRNLWRSKISGISKPYLVAVQQKELKAKSLNGDLQTLKKKSDKDDMIRKKSFDVVMKNIEVLTNHCT